MGVERPPAPTGVKVKNCGRRAALVEWDHPEEETTFVQNYGIRLQYFKVTEDTLLLKPVAQQTAVVPASSPTIEEFEHPREICTDRGLRACTLKATVQSMSKEGLEGGAATAQTTWDEQCYEERALSRHTEKMSEWYLHKTCRKFIMEKGGSTAIRVLIVGSQHHGKSSLANHIFRCLQGSVYVPDQMPSGVAGAVETTLHTREAKARLRLEGGRDFNFHLIDTPAFSNLSGENGRMFDRLLSGHFPAGSSREDLRFRTWEGRPPHGAIVVVSLTQWIANQAELTQYLDDLQRRFKRASGGKVSFPYVVAVTHRDDFLRTCRADRPHDRLRQQVQDIKGAIDVDRVHVLTNYKSGSPWNPTVNEETYQLLQSLVSLSTNEDTGRVEKLRELTDAECYMFLTIVVLLFVMYCMWQFLY